MCGGTIVFAEIGNFSSFIFQLWQWLPSFSVLGGSGKVGDCCVVSGNGGIVSWWFVWASPDCSFAFAAVNDVASSHHVVHCGIVFVFGVFVFACGAGVVRIRAKSVRPTVVEEDVVSLLVNGFGLCGGIVAVSGLVAGKFS